MSFFQDLELREGLLRTLEEEEIENPTMLQEAVLPVLRRGGNLVARASSGSGKTLAYTLGVLDRLEARSEPAEEDDAVGRPRMLVLRPTTEAAERTALVMFPYAQASDLAITVGGAGWATAVADAEILVATPAAALEAVQGSTLKLSGVEVVVIDGASAMLTLGSLETADTLLDHLPRDSQRLIFSAEVDGEVEDLAERRVKRALRYPPSAAVTRGAAEPEGELGYVLVPEGEKLELLTRFLLQPREDELPPVLFTRSDERAAELAEALTVRGFAVGEADDSDADIAIVTAGTTRDELASESGGEPGRTISYDVPPDEATMLARHGGDPGAIVLLLPRELPHLREICRRARLEPQPRPVPRERTALDGVDAFRQQLRRAIREEDLGAQMLVLEPLLEEFDAVELAAAAAALLRRRTPPAVPSAGVAAPPTAPAVSPPLAAPAAGPSPGPAPETWARLFVSIGQREGIRPGDLMGAIAGEANIPGAKIGRIDIRENFSLVDVEAELADQVIRAVNGTTIKGRSARVDYDRGSDRARRGGGERGGATGRRPRTGGERTPRRSPRRE